MKKILFICFAAILTASCGRGLYTSSSAGKDNVSYITVLTEGPAFNGVTVVVDGTDYPYGRVYTMKMKRKAQPVIITPGKHNIKVVIAGKVLVEEHVFIGLQETKQIILR